MEHMKLRRQCARSDVVAMHQFVSTPAITNLDPQGAEQTASDRIDEVSRYKVAFHLWQKSVETGAKPTRLFGAHFLLVPRWACHCTGPNRKDII